MIQLRFVTTLAVALACTVPSFADDGLTLINHAKALAGNMTPGDAPGYPVTLSKTGSYKLSGDLKAPAGKNGIDAAAVDITIDLNGFRIEGSNVGDIGIKGTQRNLTVRNGTIQRFVRGIATGGVAPIIENMRLSENSLAGIEVTSGYATIRYSSIVLNGGGISCSGKCDIQSNMIAANDIGILIATGTVQRNTIVDNKQGVFFYQSSRTSASQSALIDNIEQSNTFGWVDVFPNACIPGPAC